MNPNDLLAAVLARSDHVLWLWCFHAAVSFGLLAFAAAAPAVRADRRLLRLLLAGFAFYAFTHLESMMWVVKQWGAAATALKGSGVFHRVGDPVATELGPVTEAPHPAWIVPFHLAFDAFILYAIWVAARPKPAAMSSARPASGEAAGVGTLPGQ